jgi:hypothetical protein
VNTLFLNFFNAWVKTDTIAKKFLTELNGFDFLLDRLFAKSENSPQINEEEKKDQPAVVPAEVLAKPEGVACITLDDLFSEEPIEIVEAESDDNFLMNLAIKKVQGMQKETGAKGP